MTKLRVFLILTTFCPMAVLAQSGGLWSIASGGNGHYYEVVNKPASILWTEAQAAAISRGGYLATITSANENAYVTSLLPNNTFNWIGGLKVDQAGAVSDWRWDQTNEPWNYTNWSPTNPNNPNLEYYLQMYGKGTNVPGQWNDSTNSASFGGYVQHYVVEYAPPASAQLPRTFGLFMGVKDGSGLVPLNGDVMAREMATAFSAKEGNISHILTADATRGESIASAEIRQNLQAIKAQMRPSDSLIVYLNGHGTSFGPGNDGRGNDAVNLGFSYVDKELYAALNEIDPNGEIRKQTFIDACNAGGFWGSSDPEIGLGDLDLLGNTALFASAAEFKKMYYDFNGRGFFSQALKKAMIIGLDKFSSLSLSQYLFDESRAIASIWQQDHPVFYEGGFGDPVQTDPLLLKSLFSATSDFDINGPVSSVPEVESLYLFLLGLLPLLFARWKRRTTGGAVPANPATRTSHPVKHSLHFFSPARLNLYS